MDAVFDFFGEGKEDFYNKFEGVETVLIQGKHWEKAPLVTILLPTYKRCKLLKEALESAINQIGFDDYQIIVVDNEGEDINFITDTAKLMSKYDNDKVIYYRHKRSVIYKMDNAVKLAKSKWIVFLHDDDVLSPYHLKVLTTITGRNPTAKYISCPATTFVNSEDIFPLKQEICYLYELYNKGKNAVFSMYFPGWLGALINREVYIETGGMPSYSNGIGDVCMVHKIHYKFGIWELRSDTPLYFHRSWKGQASSGGSAVYTELYKEKYKYAKYLSRVCFPLGRDFWDRISSYQIIEEAKAMNRNIYNCGIDIIALVKQSHMSTNSLNKNKKYKLDKLVFKIYDVITRILNDRKKDSGKIFLRDFKKVPSS